MRSRGSQDILLMNQVELQAVALDVRLDRLPCSTSVWAVVLEPATSREADRDLDEVINTLVSFPVTQNAQCLAFPACFVLTIVPNPQPRTPLLSQTFSPC